MHTLNLSDNKGFFIVAETSFYVVVGDEFKLKKRQWNCVK